MAVVMLRPHRLVKLVLAAVAAVAGIAVRHLSRPVVSPSQLGLGAHRKLLAAQPALALYAMHLVETGLVALVQYQGCLVRPAHTAALVFLVTLMWKVVPVGWGSEAPIFPLVGLVGIVFLAAAHRQALILIMAMVGLGMAAVALGRAILERMEPKMEEMDMEVSSL